MVGVVGVAGVAALDVMTALGGGIIRDILIGSLPPATFRDWRYLTVALVSAMVAYLGRRFLSRMARDQPLRRRVEGAMIMI